ALALKAIAGRCGARCYCRQRLRPQAPIAPQPRPSTLAGTSPTTSATATHLSPTPAVTDAGMHYYLKLPVPGRVQLMELLAPNPPAALHACVSSLAGLREDMRLRLKDFDYDSASGIGAVIQAVEAYLYKLNGLIEHHRSGGHEAEFAAIPEFSWRSALGQSSGARRLGEMARRGIPGLKAGPAQAGSDLCGGRSLYLEQGFVLLALGVAKSISAYARVRPLDGELEASMGSVLGGAAPGREGEDADRSRRASLSSKEFAAAAGVFEHIRTCVLPLVAEDLGRAGMAAATAVDLTSDAQLMLESLALADATWLSVSMGVRSGGFKRMVLARLLLHASEQYGRALSTLAALPRGESRQVADGVRRYIKDGRQVVYAQALVQLAMAYHEERRYGLAVGFGREAQRLLEETVNKDRSVHQQTAKSLLANIVRELVASYTQSNDLIGLEPVPDRAELQALVPAGRALIAPTPYKPAVHHLAL
ncbi:hypothetical protein EV182_004574, partial [Spiromyces aspiralis]